MTCSHRTYVLSLYMMPAHAVWDTFVNSMISRKFQRPAANPPEVSILCGKCRRPVLFSLNKWVFSMRSHQTPGYHIAPTNPMSYNWRHLNMPCSPTTDSKNNIGRGWTFCHHKNHRSFRSSFQTCRSGRVAGKHTQYACNSSPSPSSLSCIKLRCFSVTSRFAFLSRGFQLYQLAICCLSLCKLSLDRSNHVLRRRGPDEWRSWVGRCMVILLFVLIFRLRRGWLGRTVEYPSYSPTDGLRLWSIGAGFVW